MLETLLQKNIFRREKYFFYTIFIKYILRVMNFYTFANQFVLNFTHLAQFFCPEMMKQTMIDRSEYFSYVSISAVGNRQSAKSPKSPK